MTAAQRNPAAVLVLLRERYGVSPGAAVRLELLSDKYGKYILAARAADGAGEALFDRQHMSHRYTVNVLSPADIEMLKHTALRGRLALALTCVEHALDHHHVPNERVRQLVDVLWRGVEQWDLGEWDDEWRNAPEAELVPEMWDSPPTPDAFADIPAFFPEILDHAVETLRAYLYAGVPGHGPESLRMTVRVLELCAANGVPLPSLARFARLPLEEQGPDRLKWGRPVPRSFFAEQEARDDR